MNKRSAQAPALAQWIENTDFTKVLEGEQLQGLDAMVRFARIASPRYRFHFDDLAWFSNEFFTRYLNRFGEAEGLNSPRRWMLAQLIRLTGEVPGDTAECGVYQGAGSWLILKASEDLDRIHHIFDSFAGLSSPGSQDGDYWAAGDMACGEAAVRDALSPFSNVSYHAGWIPDHFEDVADRQFSFVHIDVDLSDPTLQSLEFFYPRMALGGIMVFDDYGHESCVGATRSIDRYFLPLPEAPIVMPCGGAFVIKGVATRELRC